MAGNCIIPGCKTSRGAKGVTFYKLPLDNPELLEQWLQVINRKNWTPNRKDLICSKHFTKELFNYRNGRAFLKTFSVPNIISAKSQKKPAFKIKLGNSNQHKPIQVKLRSEAKSEINDVENVLSKKRAAANKKKKPKINFFSEMEPPPKITKLVPLLEPMIVVERLDEVSPAMLKCPPSASNRPEEAVKMHNKIIELESENCSLQKVVYQEQVKNKKLQAKLSKLVAESKYSVALKTPKLVIAHVKL